MIGKTVNHYRITGQLGRGGMGVVYEAEDTKLERTVALKFLPPELVGNRAAKARFEHEAKAASAIDHPNICTIHEIGETDDGHLFIAMARYEGRTLKEQIAGGPLPVETALDIARQIAEGLAMAHEREIVHRDIKPANILVTDSGLVKIVDFGLAKLSSLTRITMAGTTMGTPTYMSPEQARGEDADQRTDVWSLGVVLHEMLTGVAPFPGDNAQAVIHGILEREPDSLAEARPDLPDELTRIVDRCLAKDLDERYESAAGLLEDLHLQLGTVSIRDLDETVPQGQATRPKPASPIPWRIPVLAFVFVAVAFLAILSWAPWQERSTSRTMLAVMPFASIGPPEGAYFAEGFSDAILTRLSHIRGLGVISRQSASMSQAEEQDPRQIGEALGVDFILEGTVQRGNNAGAGESVMVRTSLVRTVDAVVMWSETFTEPINELFTLQASVAEEVAKELDLELLADEREASASPPTKDLEAYDLYLQARDVWLGADSFDDLKEVRRLLGRALALDPDFVDALCLVANLEARMFANWGEDEGLVRAEAAVARARELEPRNVNTMFSLGVVAYEGHRDFAEALEYFTMVRESHPSDSMAWFRIGIIQRRLGKWPEAIASLETALELDPRNRVIFNALVECLLLTRQFEEGLKVAERARTRKIQLSAGSYELKAMLMLGADGSLDRASLVLEEALNELPTASWGDGWMGVRLKLIRMFPDLYETLFERFVVDESSPRLRGEAAIYEAELARTLGRTEVALALADTVRTIFAPRSQVDPDAVYPRVALIAGFSGLGSNAGIIRERTVLERTHPMSQDAYNGPAMLDIFVEANVRIGDFDAALDDLEVLLSIPSRFSRPILELDPLWDPLRGDPRFIELLASSPSG